MIAPYEDYDAPAWAPHDDEAVESAAVIAEVASGFPLSWPAGWARTPAFARKRSRYELDFARSRDAIARSLRLMGARDVTISSNVPLRRDGLPRSGTREPEDPGVAVYWLVRDASGQLTRRVMACDCWRTVRENFRALALALEGMRAMERSGAAQVLDRVSQSLALAASAITAGDASNGGARDGGAERDLHWRDVLGVRGQAISREQLEDAYRALVRQRHPDAGGSHEAMTALNRARDQAMKEIG